MKLDSCLTLKHLKQNRDVCLFMCHGRQQKKKKQSEIKKCRSVNVYLLFIVLWRCDLTLTLSSSMEAETNDSLHLLSLLQTSEKHVCVNRTMISI